jgi:hypothetical protein
MEATNRRSDTTTRTTATIGRPTTSGAIATTERLHDKGENALRFQDRRKTLIACLAMAVMVALPGIAQAGDEVKEPTGEDVAVTEATIPEHQITEVLSTLPVLGSGLNVTITRDDEGAISAVGLDPADGATIVKEKDHKVVFLLSDGDTQVVVKARGGFVQTKVKADATADVTGPGSWSADVFGNGAVTIPYTVSFDGNTPTITIGDVVVPAGVTAEVGEPKTWTSDDGDKAFYKAKVKLSLDDSDDSAKVSFVAKTRVNDEGEIKVSLAVTVSTRDRDKHHDDDDDRRGDKWDRDDDDDDDRRGDRDRDDDDHDDEDRGDDDRDGGHDRDGGDDRGGDDDN